MQVSRWIDWKSNPGRIWKDAQSKSRHDTQVQFWIIHTVVVLGCVSPNLYDRRVHVDERMTYKLDSRCMWFERVLNGLYSTRDRQFSWPAIPTYQFQIIYLYGRQTEAEARNREFGKARLARDRVRAEAVSCREINYNSGPGDPYNNIIWPVVIYISVQTWPRGNFSITCPMSRWSAGTPCACANA